MEGMEGIDPAASVAAVVEYDLSAAEQQIVGRWKAYRDGAEPLGLAFGEMVSDWGAKFKKQGKKGEGLQAIFKKHDIPSSTAYYWRDRWEVKEGIKDAHVYVHPQAKKEEYEAGRPAREAQEAERHAKMLTDTPIWAATYMTEYLTRREAGDDDFAASDAAENAADNAAPFAEEQEPAFNQKPNARCAAEEEWNRLEDEKWKAENPEDAAAIEEELGEEAEAEEATDAPDADEEQASESVKSPDADATDADEDVPDENTTAINGNIVLRDGQGILLVDGGTVYLDDDVSKACIVKDKVTDFRYLRVPIREAA